MLLLQPVSFSGVARSDRPVFCGCSFPPTASGSGGPFIYQTRISIRWSPLESRIRGKFACRKDGQQLATMPWINAWYFYSHRCVDESIGVGSKLLVFSHNTRTSCVLSWRHLKRVGSRFASEKCWIPCCLSALLHIRCVLYLC